MNLEFRPSQVSRHLVQRGSFEVPIKMIAEDNAKGNRIMKHDEMSLLRHWRYGRDGVGMDRSAGYF